MSMLPSHTQLPLLARGKTRFEENWHKPWCLFLPVSVTALLLFFWRHPGNVQNCSACTLMQENCVAALGVKGNFMFESATHRLVGVSSYGHPFVHGSLPMRSSHL